MNARTRQSSKSKGEPQEMKKLIPLIIGMALAFGAVTSFAGPNPQSTKAKSTKPSKPKATKPAK